MPLRRWFLVLAILVVGLGDLRGEGEGGDCGGADGGGCEAASADGGFGGCVDPGSDGCGSNPFGLSDEEVGAIGDAYGRATAAAAVGAGLSPDAAAALGAQVAAAVVDGINAGLPAGWGFHDQLGAINAALAGFAAAQGLDPGMVGRAVGPALEAVDANG